MWCIFIQWLIKSCDSYIRVLYMQELTVSSFTEVICCKWNETLLIIRILWVTVLCSSQTNLFPQWPSLRHAHSLMPPIIADDYWPMINNQSFFKANNSLYYLILDQCLKSTWTCLHSPIYFHNATHFQVKLKWKWNEKIMKTCFSLE